MNGAKWEWIESFVAVARAGNMRRAASREVSQASLSRHVVALEEHLGYELFDRTPKGMSLTPLGERLFARAADQCERCDALLESARDAAGELSGRVRVSAPGWIAMTVLHHWLLEFRLAYPMIRVELVVRATQVDLSAREVDLALTANPPDHPDAVVRRVATLDLGFYASSSYIERRGRPTLETFREHDLIGWDTDAFFIESAREMGYDFRPEDFVLRSDNEYVQFHAIRLGTGVGVVWRALADATPELVSVVPELAIPSLDLFIVARRGFRAQPRLTAAADSLRAFVESRGFEVSGSHA